MKRLRPYLYGALFVAGSTGLRLILTSVLGFHIPYITFFAAIMLTARLGGMGPGLFATALSAICALFFFIHPALAGAPYSPDDVIGIALFCLTGVVISVLNESLRRERAWAMHVLDGISDGVIVTDTRGFVQLMNVVAGELTAWEIGQAKGESIERVFALLNERTRRPADNPVDRALRERIAVNLAEHTILRSQRGIERPIEVSASPIRSGSGQLIGAVLIFRDISDRRRLEQEIEARRMQLQAIIESITDEFSAFDHEWRYIYVNSRAAAGLEKTPEELLGQVIWDVVPVIDPVFRREIETAMRARTPVRFRTFHARSHRWFDTRIFPSDIGLSVYSSDVTENKRFEDAVSELAAIVEASDDAIVSHGLDGVIQTWNRGAETLYGYLTSEALGKNISMLSEPEKSPEVMNTLAQVAHGHTVTEIETVRQRKDGSPVEVSITTSPIRNARGGVSGASHVARDITAAKRAEEVYRENAENLQLAVRAAHMGTWRHELRTGIVTWSPELEDIFGLETGTFGGTEAAFFELVHPEDRPVAEAAVRRGIESGTEFRFDFRFLKANGEYGWMEGRGRAFYDSSGNVVRLAGVGMDITERKRAEEELVCNAQQLARANADLQQFAYVASHDLQEPLRTIASFSQLLQRRYQDRLDSEANEFLEYLVSGARRLSALVNDLLVYARLGRGEEVPFRPVDLNEAFGWATNNLKALIEETHTTVVCDPLPVVSGEAVQLVQVFQNLVSNAIKYRGERQPYIQVSAQKENSEWLISVRDNGVGIADAFHEKIFGLFQRLHGREHAGTGIGLAICRKIVERHGGRIWVESSPGQGSVFRFTLPAVESQKAA